MIGDRSSAVVAAGVFLAVLLAGAAGAEERGFLKVVKHAAIEEPGKDGQPDVGVTRFYVHLRNSEEDPRSPDFELAAPNFQAKAAFGNAMIRNVGRFGGKGSIGRGASGLLLFQLSGNTNLHWDSFYGIAMEAIDSMSKDDEVAIAFFGAEWSCSGFKGPGERDALKVWLDKQLPEEARAASKKLRKVGAAEYKRLTDRTVTWWHKFAKIDVKSTKLHKVLLQDALPFVAGGSRPLKGIFLFADMTDESNETPDHARDRSKPCTPANGCYSRGALGKTARANGTPIVGIGFPVLADGPADATNRFQLETAKNLCRQTGGDFFEAPPLEDHHALVESLRGPMERFYVVDLTFCGLPEDDEGKNFITISYLDREKKKSPDTHPYTVPISDLAAASDCKKLCSPPCSPVTHECREGACVELPPPACCRADQDCPEGSKCLGRDEGGSYDSRCDSLTGKTCEQPQAADAPAPEPPPEGCPPCRKKSGPGKCDYVLCNPSAPSEVCPEGCKCLAGEEGRVAVCEPPSSPRTDVIETEPEPEGCETDDDCAGKCEEAESCLCALKDGRQAQCMMPPEKRQGPKSCVPGPLECEEFEQALDSGHCRCQGCGSDEDCKLKKGGEYMCMDGICLQQGAAGPAGKERSAPSFIEKLKKYALPAGVIAAILIALIVLVVVRRRY